MTWALYFSVTSCYWDHLKSTLLKPNNIEGKHTQTWYYVPHAFIWSILTYFDVSLCYWDPLESMLLKPNNMEGRHREYQHYAPQSYIWSQCPIQYYLGIFYCYFMLLRSSRIDATRTKQTWKVWIIKIVLCNICLHFDNPNVQLGHICYWDPPKPTLLKPNKLWGWTYTKPTISTTIIHLKPSNVRYVTWTYLVLLYIIGTLQNGRY